MALPLPRVVADVGPGGPLVTAMGGVNSLANDMILRKINQIKAQYQPITSQAEAASKLAYANLMGPQFLAKLLGNDSAIANMGDPAAKAALQKAVSAGMGQGTGSNFLNQMPQQQQGQPSSNPLTNLTHFFADKLKGAFGGNEPQGMGAPSMQPPAQNPMQQPLRRPPGSVSIEGQQWYNKEGQPVYQEDIQESGAPPMQMTVTEGQRPKTYAENTGAYEGIVEEGKEAGKIRAAARKDLDQEYQQALQLRSPFQKLNEIITNPVFQNLRNIPGFQQLQMNAKANFGNRQEQELIGKFQAAARNVVAATVRGFGGRILASEIPLSESMKVSDKDPIGVMLGKMPLLEEFNEFTLQRSRIASRLMKEFHLDKGDALEQADKLVDGNAIRKEINVALNPVSEDDIDYTARTHGLTREQVIDRLRQEGRYNG
ncbi:MAG TPA: hypothetical protein ACFYDZ_00340 [Candidatus Brocadiaceae bacterium]